MQPEFCITRPNGVVTALIAVDELPPFVTIRGVPRCLSQIDDAHGMINVGTVGSRGQFYTVDVAVESRTHHINGTPNGEPAMTAQSSLTIEGHGVFRQSGGVDAAFLSPNSEGRNIMAWRNEVSDNAVTNTSREAAKLDETPSQRRESGTQNAKNPKTPAKKEFCSFWIRRGECDYSQQGCLFKHEMPRDLETLGRLGLRDIPRWYREKYKVKSISGSDGMDPRMDASRGWRPVGPMPTFPTPNYGLPPPRFNVGLTEGEAANWESRYALLLPIFPPNGSQFACEMGGTWRGIGLLTQTAQNVLGAHPIPALDRNNITNAAGKSASYEPVGSCASNITLLTGAPSMNFTNTASAVASSHDLDRSSIVHPHNQTDLSRSSSIWAVTSCTNGEMTPSILSPFDSMAVTEPEGPMTPEKLMTNKSKPPPSKSPFSTDNTFRNTPTTATSGLVGSHSPFSSPIPSHGRAQSFRSSRSSWTIGPTGGGATHVPLENAAGTCTSHFGDSVRYGSPHRSLKPIGFNQNGVDWRQRRLKQIVENDPFGLGLNDDACAPCPRRG
ncbi:C-x8-C-x5-C-x3-H type zinc finger protein [Histoplasma capsulatum H143]|uniref:C-x8-C-x5-C-x3-H type zinc finger protein n=1 Tax=Ajellomyces capsulatus (strain H143) TaxID=544712 RepID=C6H2X9_AJECH|nr:C-x8-C-x5-C-x3-H type zinc finger protein [Histoplasma capsulatum H143]